MSLSELRQRLDCGEISAVELTKSYLDKIEEKDKSINSYITVCRQAALRQSENAQKRIAKKEADFLTGIPLSVKDNICTAGIKTTCASKMLSDFVPIYNATVVEKLIKKDAVIIGKTNLDEFAMGSTNESSYFGAVKNPINTEYVPGGSSGGAAAGVAAGLCAAALATDTGGSIRQPASFCGVTGFKPTYGSVSRYGLIAFASSLDTIGFLTNSAEDCAYLMNGVAGEDKRDSTTSPLANRDYTAFLGCSLKGTKIGIPMEFFGEDLSPEVKNAVQKAAEFFKSCGAELIDVSLKSLEIAPDIYRIISSAEACSNLSRYDGMKYGHTSKINADYNERTALSRSEGFSEEVKKRIVFGTYVLSSDNYDNYYKKALYLRQCIKDDYEKIFKQCDMVLTPTVSSSAFKFTEKTEKILHSHTADKYTLTANLAGLPSISTTCGYDKSNMPLGMCLTGKHFDDARIISAADIFEREFKNTRIT